MKAALVTGASGDIGGAIALKLGAMGLGVAVHCCSNKPAALEIVEKIRAGGGTAMVVQGDLREEKQVDEVIAKTLEGIGQIEVLVNNAGTQWSGLLTDMTLKEWRAIMDLHLTGAFLCSRGVIPGMVRRQRGCIVNISSVWGLQGASMEAAYGAAKAGLIGLTKSLALELGPSNIRVNAVAPGVIEGRMNDIHGAEVLEYLREEIPLKRLGRPEEVAEAVGFLVNAAYITGQTLTLDGGMISTK